VCYDPPSPPDFDGGSRLSPIALERLRREVARAPQLTGERLQRVLRLWSLDEHPGNAGFAGAEGALTRSAGSLYRDDGEGGLARLVNQ
jgi:hypothetical protein